MQRWKSPHLWRSTYIWTGLIKVPSKDRACSTYITFSEVGIDLFLASSDRRLLWCGYHVLVSVVTSVLELEKKQRCSTLWLFLHLHNLYFSWYVDLTYVFAVNPRLCLEFSMTRSFILCLYVIGFNRIIIQLHHY